MIKLIITYKAVIALILLSCSFSVVAETSVNQDKSTLRRLISLILLDKVVVAPASKNSVEIALPKSYDLKINLSQKQYSNYARTSLFPDIVSLHKSLPGVVGAGDLDARIFVRGGKSKETLNILDGLVISFPFIWDGKASLINPQLIESVDFYSGTIPAKFSGMLSGVLDMKQRTGNLNRFNFQIEQNLTDFQLMLDGPIVKNEHSLLYSMRKTYYDYLIYKSGTVYPHIDSFSQIYSFKINSFNQLNVSYYNYAESMMINDLNINQGLKGIHSSGSVRKIFIANWKSLWSSTMSSQLNAGYEKSQLVWKTEINNSSTGVAYDLSPYFVNADIVNVFDNHTVMSGFSLRRENIGYEENNINILPYLEYPGSITQTTSENYTTGYNTVGLYLQDEFPIITDRLLLNIGGRFGWIPENSLEKAKSLQPRASIKLLNENSSMAIIMSYGKYSSFSNPYFQGKLLDLEPEQATQYNFGMEQKLDNNWKWKVEMYEKQYNALVYTQKNINSGVIVGYDNSKIGKSTGLELLIENHASSNWSGWMSFSVSGSGYKDYNTNWYYSDQDQRFTLSMVGTYKVSTLNKIVLNLSIASGKPYTNISGATYDATRNVYVPIKEAINSSRLPGYNNLTLILEYAKPYWPLSDLVGSSYIGVSNLLNNNNIYGYSWNDDFTQKSEIKMLPLMFIFGMKLDF